MNYLFVSNGYGEDLIACNLIQACQRTNPAIDILAIPLVGNGKAYQEIGITPLIENAMLPSNGFIRNLSALFKDITAGLLNDVRHQFQALKQYGSIAQKTICVGDFYCLALSALAIKGPLFFMPTAKSDLFMPHNLLEYKFIKRWAQCVFPRDQQTANAFQKRNVPAYFFGNPMMDNLQPTGIDFKLNNEQPKIGILPGSKSEAIENLSLILNVIDKMLSFQFLCAKTSHLSLSTFVTCLETHGWIKKDSPPQWLKFYKGSATLILSEAFTDIMFQSELLIGLAGTANEQAVFTGKKVICFKGAGTQTTQQRFLEQQKLLGPSLIFIKEEHPEKIAEHIIQIYNELPKSKADYPYLYSDASTQIMKKIIN